MKTGALGGKWVALEKPRPPAVGNHYEFWTNPPPARSQRCAYWLRQIERGWLPNRHWRAEGYDTASEVLYGVYIWEYVNEISPAISAAMEDRRHREALASHPWGINPCKQQAHIISSKAPAPIQGPALFAF